MSSKISQLRKIIERESMQSDPQWRSILQSDVRNIFPRYEISKIETMKNRMNKQRLLMEHLNDFLCMQIYLQNVQQVAKNVSEHELLESLTEIERQSGNTYELGLSSRKAQVQKLCYQLSRSKIDQLLREKLQANTKWKVYLDTYQSGVKKIDKQTREADRINLANSLSLDKLDDELMVGTAGMIIEERVRQQIENKRLMKRFMRQDSGQINNTSTGTPVSNRDKAQPVASNKVQDSA